MRQFISIAFFLAATSASADNFTFSITNTVGDVSGTVTGQILGLAPTGFSSAVQVLITGYPAGLNSVFPAGPIDATAWDQQIENSFDVEGGMIVGGGFFAKDTIGFVPEGAQLYINGGDGPFNYVNIDGGNTDQVWAEDGLAGVTFANTPEPDTFMLFATGLFAATALRIEMMRRQQARAPVRAK